MTTIVGASGTSSHHTQQQDNGDLNRAAKATFIGNFVEWFDYGAYGYLAATIAMVFLMPNLMNLSSWPKKIFSATVSPDRVPNF